MNYLGIIPARYASSRLPGKPLLKIDGQSIISRVYKQAKKAIKDVIVATDDERIVREVERYGGKAVMTSPKHENGTERCAEALDLYEKYSETVFGYVINIQGDEPFIQPEQIQLVKECFKDRNAQIGILIKVIDTREELENPNVVKAVINRYNFALYFSRSPIPYLRNTNKDEWIKHFRFYKHLGLYAYQANVLREVTKLESTPLEKAESLEQIRWLENGYKIKALITKYDSQGIDTPEDLENLKRNLT
ncbi:3-deoxy-manno-octulosonate cytidylyltransferase [Bacteroidota bacterium]